MRKINLHIVVNLFALCVRFQFCLMFFPYLPPLASRSCLFLHLNFLFASVFFYILCFCFALFFLHILYSLFLLCCRLSPIFHVLRSTLFQITQLCSLSLHYNLCDKFAWTFSCLFREIFRLVRSLNTMFYLYCIQFSSQQNK